MTTPTTHPASHLTPGCTCTHAPGDPCDTQCPLTPLNPIQQAALESQHRQGVGSALPGSLYQRRCALANRARLLQAAGTIQDFTRTAGTPANPGAAGYAVKINNDWLRLPLREMEVFLTDLAQV